MATMKLPPLSSLQWLRGSTAELTHDVRLCVLIQPNCPGCITHAIPTANKLFHSPERRGFDIYSISTAFEDFDDNTVEATRELLQGNLVGKDSRRALGTSSTTNIPEFPVAHDILTDKAKASPELLAMALEATKSNARQQASSMGIPPAVLEQALDRVTKDALPEKIASVFYTVRAQGTPTWIIHKADGQVVDVQFGHSSDEQLIGWVDQMKNKYT